MLRVNVGCGRSPTPGWRNFDNSPSLWLGRRGIPVSLLARLTKLDPHQTEYIRFARSSSIEWANATKSIPLPDGSAEVVYSSHMLEHLDRAEAVAFLGEAKRILRSGGVIRLGVPNLALYVSEYLKTGNADAFIESLYLSEPKPRSMRKKLIHFILGSRRHHWMYDGLSLRRLLEECGFVNVEECGVGQTTITDPVHLNLYERAEESIFVEALRA